MDVVTTHQKHYRYYYVSTQKLNVTSREFHTLSRVSPPCKVIASVTNCLGFETCTQMKTPTIMTRVLCRTKGSQSKQNTQEEGRMKRRSPAYSPTYIKEEI
jgi:hypothetical protein